MKTHTDRASILQSTRRTEEPILFVINPISGGGRALRTEKIIQKWGRETGRDILIQRSDFPGHATQITSDFIKSGGITAIAVGGDGTVHEVGKALIGTHAKLGIIPVGSGNGLARHLRIPMSTQRALQRIEDPNVQEIDTGWVNDHPFLMLAGWGFDAAIAREFTRSKGRGLSAYAKMVLRSMGSFCAPEVKVKEGVEWLYEGPGFFINVVNSSQFGNEFKIAASADTSDGQLDLAFLPPPPIWKFPLIATRMLLGRPLSQEYQSQRIKDITIHCEGDGLNIDGEWVPMKGPYRVRVNPASIRVLI